MIEHGLLSPLRTRTVFYAMLRTKGVALSRVAVAAKCSSDGSTIHTNRRQLQLGLSMCDLFVKCGVKLKLEIPHIFAATHGPVLTMLIPPTIPPL